MCHTTVAHGLAFIQFCIIFVENLINMKQSRSVLYVLSLFIAVMQACSSPEGRIEALPCASDSTSIDFINSKGEITKLNLAAPVVSPLVNGYFYTATPDGVTVYRLTDRGPEEVPGLAGLMSAGFMSEGVMPVCRKGGHITLVDGKGETRAVIEIADGEVTECDPMMVNGLLRVTTDKGLQGAVDADGNMVIDPIYDELGPVSANGKMLAMRSVETPEGIKSVCETLGKDGKVWGDGCFHQPLDMNLCDDRYVVWEDGRFRLYSPGTASHRDLPDWVRHIEEVAQGLLVCRAADGLKGVVDFDGNETLPPRYRQVRIGPERRVAVTDGTGWQLMDYNGGNAVAVADAVIVSPAPPQAFKEGFAFVSRTRQGAFLVDAEGKRVNPTALIAIDNGNPALSKVFTDYPARTAPLELPGEEEWE